MTAPIPILKLRAIPSDGPVHGDDLAGVIECARRVLGHAGKITIEPTDTTGLALVAWVTAGGRPMKAYGDVAATRAAKRLRREVIDALASAVERADGVLGDTHPLYRYLGVLREGCGPEAFRARTADDYQDAALRGCDLRRDA
jgi:hypothetical protein